MTFPTNKEKTSPEMIFFLSNFCESCNFVEKLIHKINFSMFGKKLKIQKISIDAKNPITDKRVLLVSGL